jgi:hypothetical protein
MIQCGRDAGMELGLIQGEPRTIEIEISLYETPLPFELAVWLARITSHEGIPYPLHFWNR